MRLDLYINPQQKRVLRSLGIKQGQIERYRGCGIQDGKIIIHTRTGGGNREYYPNKILTSNKYYISNEDDDFDCTYADYFFKIPKKWENKLNKNNSLN